MVEIRKTIENATVKRILKEEGGKKTIIRLRRDIKALANFLARAERKDVNDMVEFLIKKYAKDKYGMTYEDANGTEESRPN
jgi:hypothetical protein